MPVTPEYALSLELHYLRETVVASEMWRAVVAQPLADWTTVKALADAATSSEANARAQVIRERTNEADAAQDPPRCIVRHLNDSDIEKLGSGSSWATDGMLSLLFELPVPTAYQGESAIDDAVVAFENVIGRIISEMQTVAGTAGYLNILRFVRLDFGQYDTRDTNGDLIRAANYVVHFNGE